MISFFVNRLDLDDRKSPLDAVGAGSPVFLTAGSLCREILPSAGARRKCGSHLSRHTPNTTCEVSPPVSMSCVIKVKNNK